MVCKYSELPMEIYIEYSKHMGTYSSFLSLARLLTSLSQDFCIEVIALLFAIMSFFYKYVDLSGQNESPNNNVANSQLSNETHALILSQSDGKLNDQTVPNYINDEGNESEFCCDCNPFNHVMYILIPKYYYYKSI